MSLLSEEEIAKAFGPGPAKEPPRTAAEGAVAGVKVLDDKLAGLVEKHRRADESHAQAFVRVSNENPALMDAYERERSKVMKAHGFEGSDE